MLKPGLESSVIQPFMLVKIGHRFITISKQSFDKYPSLFYNKDTIQP